MPPRSPADLLADIVDHIDLATQFTVGATIEDYVGDDLRRLAVERALEVVGEATRQLTYADASVASRLIDASGLIAFRNVIAHRYFDLDHPRILAIIGQRLPGVRRQAVDARRFA